MNKKINYSKHLHVLLTSEEHRFLQILAKKEKRSIGDVIRGFVQGYMHLGKIVKNTGVHL